MTKQDDGAGNYQPDYGMYMAKTMPNARSAVFMCFVMDSFSRIGDSRYTTASTWVHGGKEFCVSLDFNNEMYQKFLGILPADISKQLKELFQKPFTGPLTVNFPSQIAIQTTAQLGEKITNGKEEYIPFNVTNIAPAEQPTLNAPNAAKESQKEDITGEKIALALAKSLYAIGRENSFISPEGVKNHKAIEAGKMLNELGGLSLMQLISKQVVTLLREREGKDLARDLEHCWNGIGEWRA